MKRTLTLLLSVIMAVSCLCLPCSFAQDGLKAVNVNDGDVGSELLQFEFSGSWGHDQNLPDLFEGATNTGPLPPSMPPQTVIPPSHSVLWE